ncbi:MAG: DUF167 domain-containing protein [Anaplasmataceae bacterium]|nr:DUF167 domain-containing protein [Anaplasmataceae bacterium]
MIYEVKVKTSAKKDNISLISENKLRVEVKAKAENGKANKALMKLLSEHFSVAQSLITIKRGSKSKNKIIQIESQ